MKTHELLIQPDRKGESQFTRAFLQYLQGQYSASSGRRTGRMHSPLRTAQSRIALIWDGASYHRSREVKSYLDLVNQGLEPKNWKITCIRFAPNAPEQNPIEDVWLSAKRFLREFYSLCSTFAIALRARLRHR